MQTERAKGKETSECKLRDQVTMKMRYNFGIILLSFGTTYAETRKKNIHALTARVKEAYPDVPVLEAFSSVRVRKILKERDGIWIDSLEEALEKMKKFGLRQVIVCPTHILGGHEYEKCKAIVDAQGGWLQEAGMTVDFGSPLLERGEDYPKVAKAFWDGFSAYLNETGDTPRDRRTVPMGHGTSHEADVSYRKLEAELQRYSGQEIYIATVEGETRIEHVVEKLAKTKSPEDKSSVYLLPFMLVAGDHAVHDMAGEEDSFASVLKQHGYEPVCVLKGIGEYPEIQELYLEKIKKQIKHLEDLLCQM